MDDCLLGVDIGTYSSKGVLVTTRGEVVCSVSVEHGLLLPRPGWAEHDAEVTWWGDFVTLTRRLLAESGVRPERILAAGASAIAPCVLPVDASGMPLRPAILYGVDTRAVDEIAYLEATLGRDAIFRTGGVRLSAQSAGPKILWLARHEPDVWAATRLIFPGSGYITYRLTGEATIDVYTATAYAPLLDVSGPRWSAEMAREVAPLDRLPRLAWSAEVVGRVTRQAAAETGLAAGTPVIAGTADAASEALSAGLAHTGDLMVMYGSSAFFIQKTARAVETEVFWSAPFMEPGTHVVAGGMSAAGSLTRWFRDNLASAELAAEQAGGPNAYAALAELAAASPPGARGLVMLPYFSGERTPLNDPRARGVVAGLTLSHTRADLYRSLLEAVGYGIRHNVDAMAEQGIPPRRVLAVGGGTRNPLWLQIVTDILGVEQHVPQVQHGACYGDAFLAAIGAGVYRSTADIGEWVKEPSVVRPDAERHSQYEPYYRVYRDLYAASAEQLHRLAALGET
jgi:xylulokinase